MLEMSESMSPNVTAEKDGGELVEGYNDYESDMVIDVISLIRVKLTRGGAFEKKDFNTCQWGTKGPLPI